MKDIRIFDALFAIAPTIVLLVLSFAAYKKDYFNPNFLRDPQGNPPEYPMPYITMWLCKATAGLNVATVILGVIGVKISGLWSLLLLLIIIATIAAELCQMLSMDMTGGSWTGQRLSWF